MHVFGTISWNTGHERKSSEKKKKFQATGKGSKQLYNWQPQNWTKEQLHLLRNKHEFNRKLPWLWRILKKRQKRKIDSIRRSIRLLLRVRTWIKLFKQLFMAVTLLCRPHTLYVTTQLGQTPNWSPACRNILQVQRKTPNNVCKAELRQYPLIINIQKRALKFWQHLQMSDCLSLHHKALKSQEQITWESLGDLTPMHFTEAHDNETPSTNIWPNKITTTGKENYVTHWKEFISQAKSTLFGPKSWLYNCYLPEYREQPLRTKPWPCPGWPLKKTDTHTELAAQTEETTEFTLRSGLYFLTRCPKYSEI